jgi:hypothetical protein
VGAGGIHRLSYQLPTRWNGSTGRSAAAPTWGDLPNDAALLRLAGALLIEQNDEWMVARRYLSHESLELVLVDEPVTQEVAQLTRPEPPTTILSYTTSRDLTHDPRNAGSGQ